MKLPLPPGHTEASLRAGLAAMAKIVGDAHVFTKPEHLAAFRDPYSMEAADSSLPLAWPPRRSKRCSPC